jgi:hypothetical protein
MSSIGGGALPPGASPPGGAGGPQPGNVVAQAGAGVALELGQVYSAEVTALLDGKTEILLGNRYLLAATPFNFSVGDRLALRLTQQTAQLLTFQLALPGTESAAPAADTAAELTALLRAAGLADTTANRAVLTTLLQAGIPLSQRSFSEVAQLMAELPGLPLAGFIPLYKELLDRQLQPPQAVLRQLALLSLQRPDAAGLLPEIAAFRPAAKPRRAPVGAAGDALSEAGSEADDDGSGAGAAELQQLARLLYSSPEFELAEALRAAHGRAGGRVTVELQDLANVTPGATEDNSPALALATALRVRHALQPAQGTLLIPLDFDGERVEARLDFRQLAQRYYQRDFHMRLSLRTAAQGPVEVQFHTHGAGLSVSILAAEPGTAQAYDAELAGLRRDLERGDTGYVLHKLEAGLASLGPSAPLSEALP